MAVDTQDVLRQALSHGDYAIVDATDCQLSTIRHLRAVDIPPHCSNSLSLKWDFVPVACIYKLLPVNVNKYKKDVTFLTAVTSDIKFSSLNVALLVADKLELFEVKIDEFHLRYTQLVNAFHPV